MEVRRQAEATQVSMSTLGILIHAVCHDCALYTGNRHNEALIAIQKNLTSCKGMKTLNGVTFPSLTPREILKSDALSKKDVRELVEDIGGCHPKGNISQHNEFKPVYLINEEC